MLWIAFIFQYLWDTKQPRLQCAILSNGCELLSFFSIFGIQNNDSIELNSVLLVVNCFHFSVSLGYKTTDIVKAPFSFKLWIAFIFQYLWDTKQLKNKRYKFAHSCELLSFFSIFGIQNNTCAGWFWFPTVVNCFHFSVSLGYKTTHWMQVLLQFLLWIAFIFQYLWDTKQLCIFVK